SQLSTPLWSGRGSKCTPAFNAAALLSRALLLGGRSLSRHGSRGLSRAKSSLSSWQDPSLVPPRLGESPCPTTSSMVLRYPLRTSTLDEPAAVHASAGVGGSTAQLSEGQRQLRLRLMSRVEIGRVK
ncbi:MAG: hypothetical protein SGPRY_003934, partial [Prymnesium sp.]